MTAEQRVELILETHAKCGVDQQKSCTVCVAFMLHQIKRAEAAARADERATIGPKRSQGSHCLECGPNVPVDEDGCCVTCGRDSMWYEGAPCRCKDFESGACPQCLHVIDRRARDPNKWGTVPGE